MEQFDLEASIAQWKEFLSRLGAIDSNDISELEDHLRDQIDGLREAGLADDEAFLIATKRIGRLDEVSREYAAVHSGRLWKNLVFSRDSTGEPDSGAGAEFLVVLALALGAALAIKVPALFGLDFEEDATALVYLRNLSLFCFPFLTLYFVWKRKLGAISWRFLLPPFVASALIVNLYPYAAEGSTVVLTILHLPIGLWFIVGVAYTGNWWRTDARRMDFVRFSGEIVIYYVLIAIGGGILTAFTAGMFQVIGFDLEWAVVNWIIPCGAMGAVLVAAWLVEAKQAAIENMAPVLTRVFTPLFTLLLLAFLITMLVTGRGIDVQREVLIGFDLLLALVLGLVLYAVSSRRPEQPPGWFDLLQLTLVIAALLVDILALLAIAGRITEFGFSPNRVAALGENLVLLVALAGYAWRYLRFIRGQDGFAVLERWQTGYIPVYAAWAALVVVVFPPLFGFL